MSPFEISYRDPLTVFEAALHVTEPVASELGHLRVELVSGLAAVEHPDQVEAHQVGSTVLTAAKHH